MCRNGPLPERYLHCTDMLCIFIFVLLGIFVFIIACIDWSQVTSQTVTSETSANTVPIINQFLIDMVLAALTAIATGIIISLLAIFIPNFMSIFMVLFLLLSFLGIALLALWDFKKDDHSIEWLVVIVLSFSSFIVASVIIYRRRMKIKHFG